jgi:LmbE family N-acetylglucosaminyl deacetylase
VGGTLRRGAARPTHAPVILDRASLVRALGLAFLLSLAASDAGAQRAPERVLVRSLDSGPEGTLPADRGTPGLRHRLEKLRTTGSVLYTTGHPDDEEAGALVLLSRGMGARTALLTLNRGEGGANALGPELFDALGLIRTEELRLAGRWYGLDDQYFTTAADYGYSKTLDEAMRSWDREALLEDMVRIIRTNRPLVVVSRWFGDGRDGHGHHQAAGVLTPEAVEAAADPARFPDQITYEGLRPWRVRKVYRSRLLPGDAHHLELDPGAWAPALGATWQDFGAYGLSLQRSQTSGRVRTGGATREPLRWQRVRPDPDATQVESSMFDGLDVSLPGVARLTGERLDPMAAAALEEADGRIARAIDAFDLTAPGPVVPELAGALLAIRRARAVTARDSDTDFLLAVKERQTADALVVAAGIEVEAIAVPQGAGAGATMGPAVPGQSLDVHVRYASGMPDVSRLVGLEIASRAGWTSAGPVFPGATAGGAEAGHLLSLRIPVDAAATRPYFARPDIRRDMYSVADSAEIHLGESRPRAEVVATLEVEGVPVEVFAPVQTLESAAPFGMRRRPLEVVPSLTLDVTPSVIVPRPSAPEFDVAVRVTAHAPRVTARVGVDVPAGWTADARTISLEGEGSAETVTLTVRPGPDLATGGRDVVLRARAEVDGRVVHEGYETIVHPDLQARRLWRDATVTVAPVDVIVAQDLRVGYVMGVGDQVPEAIAQLGADVTLLDAAAVAGADLSAYDAVVVGTRAYAVRPDLVAANPRLLDYARGGGNVVVLYQTPEYRPREQAPFPASLPGNAEEVSEQDAPVTILAPDHPLITTPNRIGPADFDGWIEQRGSKFFADWEDAYTALVETHDTGQAPQRGIWLTAEVGEGRFTYVALALHRQIPYGVHGAWRILANLVSAGR